MMGIGIGIGGRRRATATTPTLFTPTLYNEAGSSTITAVSALRVSINAGAWQTLTAAGLSISQGAGGTLVVTGFAGTETSIRWHYEHEWPGETFNLEGTVSGLYARGAAAPANTSLPGLPLAQSFYDSPVVTTS